jgi:HK97 gp10 family phage protein
MSDFSYSIKFENNSAEFQNVLKQNEEKILYAMGVKGVEGAVDAISGRYSVNKAVDTGRLRASISFVTAGGQKGTGESPVANSQSGDTLSGKAEEKTVIIGSNVEYAEYVHDGTSKMDGRPFLREGIDRTKDEMKEQVLGILKGEY